jgi:hypothetical protein
VHSEEAVRALDPGLDAHMSQMASATAERAGSPMGELGMCAPRSRFCVARALP